MKKTMFILTGLLLAFQAIGQSVLDKQLDFSVTNMPVADALLTLCEKADVSISFQSSLFEETPVLNFQFQNKRLNFLLKACLRNTDIGFKLVDERIALFQKPPPIYTISGFVEDSLSGERLVAATVYDQLSGKGTTTNEYGFYSLSIPKGKANLSFSYLGFNSNTYRLNIRKNLSFNVSLKSAITLAEVVVSSQKYSLKDGLSVVEAPNYALKALHKLPTVGGEPDIIRYFQTLPGVEAGSGNLGGQHVRGGESGQNLVLLDGVPVYNPSHTLGLFSIFSENIIKSARIYKGKFPAKYGGRLSSVIDIQTKEGNDKQFKFGAGLSLFATNVFAEGPIKKDTTSFFVSVRRTHLDPVFSAIDNNSADGGGSRVGYHFYDINAKVNHTLSAKDKLYLSFYSGADKFSTTSVNNENFILGEDLEEPSFLLTSTGDFLNINWGNTILSSRWNRVWNNKLFSNTTFTYSQFGFQIFSTSEDEFEENDRIYSELSQYDFDSSIEDVALKMDFDYLPNNKHHFKFGGGVMQRIFKPVLRFQEIELEDFDFQFGDEYYVEDPFLEDIQYFATELNLYLEDDINITDRLTAQIGFHNALFTASNNAWNTFQPRLSLQYQLHPKGNIYTAYSEMSQFLHVLSPAGVSMPFDLWVPSTGKVKPELARQILVGTRWKLPADFTFGAEAYYKKLDHLITYRREIADFFLGEDNQAFSWEEEVTTGQGWNYGIETSLSRTKGKASGYLNYTWAKSERQFDGLSQNERFQFRFNREHVLKIGFNQEFGAKFGIYATWFYGAGQYTTPRVIDIQGNLDNFDPFQLTLNNSADQLNDFRLPAHHKLDLSFNFHWPKKQVEHYFSFSIQNVYARRNPLFSIRYTETENPGEVKEEDIAGIPIFPGLRYAIKF